MAASNYGCSQSELYTTCRNAWLLCQMYLSQFMAYKSKYSAAFVAENLALITTVEEMDNFEARKAPVKELRKDVLNEKADATALYVRLKGYVTEAYRDNKKALEASYTEMGQAFYEKLNAKGGTDVSGLLSAMIPFVRSHQTELKEKGYMPDGFLGQLEEKQTSFTAAHQSWKDEADTQLDATSAKVAANNDLKARVMAMLADGQVAFCNDKATAQKFVWATLLAPVRGMKPTGFTGKISDKATEGPLSIVTIFIESLNMTVACDKNGRFQFVVPTADKLTIVFKAEGYQTVTMEAKEVKAGVMSRLNVEMEAVVV